MRMLITVLAFKAPNSTAFCLLIQLLSGLISIAQVMPENSAYIVKLDSFKIADKPIPFDQDFTMIVATRQPQNVALVQVYKTVFTDNQKPRIGNGNTPIQQIIPEVIGGQLYLAFEALPPKFNFDFYLQRKLDGKLLDQLLEFLDFVAYNSIAPWPDPSRNKKQNEFLNFHSQVEPADTTFPKAFLYDYLFVDKCRAESKADRENSECDDRSLENILSPPLLTEYHKLFGLRGSVGVYAELGNDLNYVYARAGANKLNTGILQKFIRIYNDQRLDSLMAGIVNFDYDFQSGSAKIYEVKKRLDNLDSSSKQMYALLEMVESLKMAYVAPDLKINNLYNYLKSNYLALSESKKNAKQSIDFIRERVQGVPGLVYAEWYINNSTNFRDLQTKSGSLFSAQIGIAGMQVNRHIEGVAVVPKLTAGVNFNFRPIDKSLDRRKIQNKAFAHNISGYLGVTFGKFQNEQFDNFLPSNSLLLGLNWRIFDVVYVSGGTSLFRQKFRNPLINSGHLQFGAYLALLIDLDIAKAATNLTSILFK